MKRLGWGGLIGGLALLAVCITFTVLNLKGPISEIADGRVYLVPGTAEVDLEGGHTYVIYEEGSSPTIRPDDVEISGPDGGEITAQSTTANQTLTYGDSKFTGAVQFKSTTGGTYEITVESREQTRITVSQSLIGIAKSVVGWIIGIFFGGLIILAAIVILIIAYTRRKGPQQPLGPPAPSLGPPPGWYADPWNPAQQRWWNGTAWTDSANRPPG